MKKILILLLLNTLVSFSQNKSGTVTYKSYPAVVNKVDSTKFDQEAYKLVSNMTKSREKLEFSLVYNTKYSKFSLIDKLETDNNVGMDFAKSVFGYLEYYYDFTQKYFITNDKNNKGKLVKLNSTYEWNLTPESKDINGNLCYKATCDHKFMSRKGEVTRKVIAWFCPKIPVNSAPENFNGLPGLVLELNTGMTVYVAKEIKFSDKEITIDFPKGKVISEEENSSKTKAKLEEMLNNR